ncbi:hypothetical protein N8940_02615 [Sphingomonadaceae bacterium]|nr:hypothetical protein [Sphingomonadaceae bacterium]
MKANRGTLLKLKRLERLREVERLSAARDVAHHESTLARATALARRSAVLADTHTNKHGGKQRATGGELQSSASFTNEISALSRLAAQECEGAEIGAGAARLILASASHRRDRAAERAQSLSRELIIAKSVTQNPILARKLYSR